MRNRRESGYSLPEMLTVVAIIGTLALVSVPAFITFRNANKMKGSMRNFATDLRSMRQRSISQGVQMAVSYEISATTPSAPSDFKRRYYFYQGDAPFNSVIWTPITLPGQTAAATHTLDDVVYFPAPTAATPQTFTTVVPPGTPATDAIKCDSTGCKCVGTFDTRCAANGDGRPDIVFYPDGRVLLPSGTAVGYATLATDMRIPTKKFMMELSPSGRIKSCTDITNVPCTQ